MENDVNDSARALRESEELHRITLQNMSDAVFITNELGMFTYVCPNVDVIFGYRQDEVQAMGKISCLLGRELIDRDQLAASGEARNVEHEIVTKGGTRRALLVHIKQVAIKGGTTLYVCRDITERHELREVSGLLIHAHEQERIRLSRELHDDVAQRVSLLALELSEHRDRLKEAPLDVRQQVAKLLAQTQEIGSELHRLAHELHPARLKQLGLEASIRSFCRELGNARRIAIRVEIGGIPNELDSSVALCLYRITQEALQNVVKHSGATRAMVALSRARDEMFLTVIDNGHGFDAAAVDTKGTLGTVSMRERARQARGEMFVTSKPGHGTWVEVLVPFRN
jgi:PAS domain S-box-containing protein